jgi:hypothetical protein
VSEPLEPLSHDLAELFERERRTYAVEPAIKERVFRGVSRAALFSVPQSVGTGGAPQASTTASREAGASAAPWTASRVIAAVTTAFIAGGVLGGSIVATRQMAREDPPTVVPVPTVTAPVASVPANAPDDSVPSSPQPAAQSAGQAHAMSSPPSSASSERVGTVAREREVLDAARAALSHGRSGEALAAVREHQRRWPHGVLEEEREVLAVRALVATGETAVACARAVRFRRAFPESMLSDVVSSALANAGCAEGAEQ